MPHWAEPSQYRIVRHAPGVLHLYRGDQLVDIDAEADEDSRADIERWGSGVAWAEDYTGIERWDAVEGDQKWRTLIGVSFRYVTWQFERATCWEEVDSSGWATRHVEAQGSDLTYTAAASLAEVLASRDGGGIDAVRAYEQLYGVSPEASFPAAVLAGLTQISGLEFVNRWMAARASLEAQRR